MKEIVNVFLVQGKRVVLCGQCGDNFGEVQDIDTLEKFTTYGYNSINFNNKMAIGTVEKEVKTIYKNYK